MTPIHIPVLLDSVLEYLDIQKNDIILDGTLGFGGHASELLKHLSSGQYIGIDQDEKAREHCKEKFKERTNVTILDGNFSKFIPILESNKLPLPTKILIDIGYSSFQLDTGY
jgi:16S rRNA (cytosine1402-N4)-methyltransferase